MTAFDYSRCAIPKGCERRVFWTTQPHACEPETVCDAECARSGLIWLDSDEGRRIASSNFAIGLALNILGTDARRDETDCGHRPGRLGGHWTEGFMKSATGRVGTRLRSVDMSGRIEQQVRSAEACAQFDLNKLVTYGVAISVVCTGTYKGSGRVGIAAVINGPTAELGRVGFNGSRVSNAWVWQL